jgi:transposase
MLTDAQWTDLDLLVEACRPKGKTPPQDLRRTFTAILWRHENGAKWRAIPADLGPWWRAAQTFIRWARLGVWERMLLLAQERGPGARRPTRDDVSGRHQHPGPPESGRCRSKRGSSAERNTREALGRSRGGYGTKACVIADGLGRAVAFILAPGQAHELPHAVPLLERLPGVPKWVVADRGYASHAFREHIWSLGARPAIPSKRNEEEVACPDWIYANRNHVERLWARLKEWRAVATRYEKTASSFMGVLCLAATIDWLKP